MIKSIVDRQIEFQKGMQSNKKTMYLAFVEELGELVASFGYADWKEVKRDEDNILIELVDLAVFAINLAYYANKPHRDISVMSPGCEYVLVKELVRDLANQDYIHAYMRIFAYDSRVAEIITAKQALNTLRQDYGYKEGKYQKLWQDDKEDNTFLPTVYGKSYDEAYAALEDTYVNKVLARVLINVFDD